MTPGRNLNNQARAADPHSHTAFPAQRLACVQKSPHQRPGPCPGFPGFRPFDRRPRPTASPAGRSSSSLRPSRGLTSLEAASGANTTRALEQGWPIPNPCTAQPARHELPAILRAPGPQACAASLRPVFLPRHRGISFPRTLKAPGLPLKPTAFFPPHPGLSSFPALARCCPEKVTPGPRKPRPPQAPSSPPPAAGPASHLPVLLPRGRGPGVLERAGVAGTESAGQTSGRRGKSKGEHKRRLERQIDRAIEATRPHPHRPGPAAGRQLLPAGSRRDRAPGRPAPRLRPPARSPPGGPRPRSAPRPA
ncbi:PREDICTED: translation initiation factor IF-2-like, partial [Chinchilla lanigera]|uniref:translation initiation factor IF-2-like n=1 Tax=Chinchilla lanigera TaxID=34839 RepID=UPI000697A03D